MAVSEACVWNHAYLPLVGRYDPCVRVELCCSLYPYSYRKTGRKAIHTMDSNITQ